MRTQFACHALKFSQKPIIGWFVGKGVEWKSWGCSQDSPFQTHWLRCFVEAEFVKVGKQNALRWKLSRIIWMAYFINLCYLRLRLRLIYFINLCWSNINSSRLTFSPVKHGHRSSMRIRINNWRRLRRKISRRKNIQDFIKLLIL